MENVPGAESVVGSQPVTLILFADAELREAETILLVEDEAFVRKATAVVLESAGYNLMTAANAAGGLEIFRTSSQRVDLLLTDIVMPGMSGRELAAEFKIFSPLGRVLLMSGFATELTLCELCLPGSNYLSKPFSQAILLNKVRETLSRSCLS